LPQTLKHKLYSFFTFFLFLIIGGNVFSQVETVPVTHPVYEYLKIMQIKKVIPDYNTSVTPFTRSDIASYLKKIGDSKNLSRTEKKQLEDFQIEFEYEINKTLKNTTSLFSKFDESSLFGNKKQKYLYKYADSNATLFMGLAGELYSRSLKADGGDHSILIGDLGLGIRGTLYGRLGYTLNITGGKRFSGKNSDLQFAVDNDPILKSNRDFISGNKNFDFFTGNLRFQTKAKWFSLTLGREALNCGYGYIDKLFLSNNTVPFDFLKLDLAYKKVKYTFTYGSLQGDSLGAELKSKNIAFHRINIQFSDVFKAGFYESVIMSNNPFSFVFFNPISFITSADLNTGAKQTTENNTLMGFDFEINPVKNIALQGSILIDDINMSTIFKNDETSFDNKIGYQAGSIWANAFQIPDMNLTIEYTRLNPFIYSHRSNKDSYTHWGLSLGHELPPNSDEIAVKLKYYISNRLVVNFLYQFQRSAQGIYFDSTINKLINYGGTINRGDGDEVINNKFLLGDRINRNIFTIDFIFEPIKQYTFELRYQHKYLNFIYLSKKEQESQFYAVFKVFF
jgi:hypothetical protein